jgi:putative transposase
MRRLGLMAIYQKPKTSQPHPGHKIYPYLLRGLAINRPDQVWCADITDVRMRRGFLYLAAVMDWHSRAVLSWTLSNTLDADFCVAALEETMNRHGMPELFHTDQGSQFTARNSPRRSRMPASPTPDGKGRWMDDVFVERLCAR